MLPHVQLEQRDGGHRDAVLLVVELLDDQVAADRLVGQHGPAGALDAGGGAVELLLECCGGRAKLALGFEEGIGASLWNKREKKSMSRSIFRRVH